MFEPLEPQRITRSELASGIAHGLLIAAIAFHYSPTVVKISSIMKGDHGTARVTQLASDTEDIAFPVIAKSERSPFSTLKLRAQKKPKKLKQDNNRAEETTTRAGASYGSLSDGPEYGSEVRPALPYVFPDPPVSRDDLPPGIQGKIIVEITIDELGNVIDTKLLQGLHPAIDAKVIATLKMWRFRPATRDGRAIASKQDALFNYPS
jgi:TonB family protein